MSGSRKQADTDSVNEKAAAEEPEAEAVVEEAAVEETPEGATGLKYVVANYRITHDFRLGQGVTKTVGWNEGDVIVDDGSEFNLPSYSIRSLAAEGYLRLAEETKE